MFAEAVCSCAAVGSVLAGAEYRCAESLRVLPEAVRSCPDIVFALVKTVYKCAPAFTCWQGPLSVVPRSSARKWRLSSLLPRPSMRLRMVPAVVAKCFGVRGGRLQMRRGPACIHGGRLQLCRRFSCVCGGCKMIIALLILLQQIQLYPDAIAFKLCNFESHGRPCGRVWSFLGSRVPFSIISMFSIRPFCVEVCTGDSIENR